MNFCKSMKPQRHDRVQPSDVEISKLQKELPATQKTKFRQQVPLHFAQAQIHAQKPTGVVFVAARLLHSPAPIDHGLGQSARERPRVQLEAQVE